MAMTFWTASALSLSQVYANAPIHGGNVRSTSDFHAFILFKLHARRHFLTQIVEPVDSGAL